MKNQTNNDLRQLREALLELHKNLIHHQKRAYEKKHGKLESRHKLYQLVTDHPEFSWIRQLSELIVSMDELQDKKILLSTSQKRDLLKYVHRLLTISKHKTKFEKEYQHAVQQNPSVTIAHAGVMQALRKMMGADD